MSFQHEYIDAQKERIRFFACHNSLNSEVGAMQAKGGDKLFVF